MTPSADLEFAYSKGKLVKLAIGALGFTVVSLLFAMRVFPKVQPGSFEEFIGYAGTLFFGLCFVFICHRLFGDNGPVLFLSASGIRDVRVAAEEIPWSAILTFSHVAIRRQRFVVIGVVPDLEERLTLTRASRWSRGPNKALGIDGLCVSVSGLNIDFDSFYDLCEMRLRRVREGASQDGSSLSAPDFSLRASDRI